MNEYVAGNLRKLSMALELCTPTKPNHQWLLITHHQPLLQEGVNERPVAVHVVIRYVPVETLAKQFGQPARILSYTVKSGC